MVQGDRAVMVPELVEFEDDLVEVLLGADGYFHEFSLKQCFLYSQTVYPIIGSKIKGGTN